MSYMLEFCKKIKEAGGPTHEWRYNENTHNVTCGDYEATIEDIAPHTDGLNIRIGPINLPSDYPRDTAIKDIIYCIFCGCS